MISRLHPSVRYALAANLGWTSLRPVQDGAIPPILEGATTVVLAPTAGGKTEAAMLPLLSRVLDERWSPTSIVYVAPLRALLNDLGERVGDLANHLGLSAAVWHGDTTQAERRKIVAAPPDVLLTTPESLEVLLSLASGERRIILSAIRAIVIDEAHAFYGVDRGTHLLALLERLQHFAAHDLQRIALSATIGNPDDLLAWLAGSSVRERSLVRIVKDASRIEEFDVSYCDGLSATVTELQRFRHEKTIVFARTRADVEELANALDAIGMPAWPHHSALSRVNREDAEVQFRASASGALVATSTLELGIDIGDLDRVVQVDAPTTVAALLQRLGRSGRRGAPGKMSFIPTNPEQLVLTLALLSLHHDGWIEPLVPPWRPFPILAQQALAIVLQNGGIAQTELVQTLSANAAFARITELEVKAAIQHLLAIDVLTAIDGSLSFGTYGERRYGRRNFMELASVFMTTETITVFDGDREVGSLDRWFVDEMLARDRSTFLLNGQAWNVEAWPEAGSTLQVQRSAHAEAPLFTGGGLVLGFEAMQRIRSLLAGSRDVADRLPINCSVSTSTLETFERTRATTSAHKLAIPSCPLVQEGSFWVWYTYAGIRANRYLADLVFGNTDVTFTVTNMAIRVRTPVMSAATITQQLEVFAQGDSGLSDYVGLTPTPTVDVKFKDLVEMNAWRSFARERAYDIKGARAVARQGIRTAIGSHE